ncbi:MAG: acyl-CoA thioesterase [Clostridiales bacterium]|jgi:acyl-CoA hydrolase|nr:acyl-CoA thioesterase [Clostridiales bacterium]MCI2191735.1 acyl-CoA thioesterase [Oscillospiraceae bacterium]MCI1961840.1 acyl-CoA thioesterase [Clostridiales bacterium]MCI2022427.1 acyl-CoA thioesterase [Clostridiales bacterium]MCI2026824.1 acyl-CoA thioesterase [Clostridiales bacterium]
METRPSKHVSESAVVQTQIVLSSHINGAGRLFGGQLVEWIDVVAGVVARRHSHCNTTTASIDNLQFKEAVHINDTVLLFGKITYVGRTSMEVQVDSYVEELDGSRKLVNTAHFVMVALDKDEHPTMVPSLIIETDEEKAAWKSGEKRDALRKQRRIEQY